MPDHKVGIITSGKNQTLTSDFRLSQTSGQAVRFEPAAAFFLSLIFKSRRAQAGLPLT